MKFTKLNQFGVAHLLAPLIIVVGVAAVGTYIFIASHADVPTRLLYVDGNGNINATSVDGKVTQNLNTYGNYPVAIKSNSLIAYQSGEGTTGTGTATMDMAGQNKKVILPYSGCPCNLGSVSWSEVRQKLVTTVYDSNRQTGTLSVSNYSGSNKQVLFTDSTDRYNYSDAQWSPDGRQILFMANTPSGFGNEYVTNLAGSVVKNISQPGVTYMYGQQSHNVWSPDSSSVLARTISFANVSGNVKSTIHLDTQNVSTGALTELTTVVLNSNGTDNNNNFGIATWSPDGSKVAYSYKTNGVVHVATYDTATKTVQIVFSRNQNTSQYNIREIAWSPDSTTLAFTNTISDSSGQTTEDVYTLTLNPKNLVHIKTLTPGSTAFYGAINWTE